CSRSRLPRELSRGEGYGLADLHAAFAQYARIEAAPARVDLLRHAHELAAGEVGQEVVARRRVGSELELDRADLERHARNHAVPGHAGEREVLADAADVDGVAIGLKRVDQLERVERHRAARPAVVAQVALPVALHAAEAHGGGASRQLWHAAGGDIYGMQHTAHASLSPGPEWPMTVWGIV